jgi:hypothetical protein
VTRYDGWDWVVRCYYADDVKPPKRPGGLAIETVHRGDHSKDMEVAVAEARDDIGVVSVVTATAAEQAARRITG